MSREVTAVRARIARFWLENTPATCPWLRGFKDRLQTVTAHAHARAEKSRSDTQRLAQRARGCARRDVLRVVIALTSWRFAAQALARAAVTNATSGTPRTAFAMNSSWSLDKRHLDVDPVADHAHWCGLRYSQERRRRASHTDLRSARRHRPQSGSRATSFRWLGTGPVDTRTMSRVSSRRCSGLAWSRRSMTVSNRRTASSPLRRMG